MSTRVAIIGVVGKSNVDQSRLGLLDSARTVGCLIAESGNIVLTGGHHDFKEESVKHYALLGAFDASKAGRKVGVLGIPPGKMSTALRKSIGDVEENYSVDQLRYWVYPHTGLSSGERNPLTGKTPDILIALYGKEGTPQEVSEAIQAGRHVVFLNSWEALREELTAHPRELHTATMEKEAVDLALRLLRSEAQLCGGFPSTYSPLSSGFCHKVQEATAWLREQVAATERLTPASTGRPASPSAR